MAFNSQQIKSCSWKFGIILNNNYYLCPAFNHLSFIKNMKKITDILFSPKVTLVLLFVFAAAVGTATFIEEKYDTVTANLLVYHTWWLEFILIWLSINFISMIGKYHMFRREKLPSLVFHLAFIILIIGAGFTRYLGFEGSMHIREGESADIIYSAKPFLQITATGKGVEHESYRDLWLSQYTRNAFHETIRMKDQGTIRIEYADYMTNAVEKAEENVPGGARILELLVAGNNEKKTVFIKEGEIADVANTTISYNNGSGMKGIILTGDSSKIYIKSPSGIIKTTMHDMMHPSDSNTYASAPDSIQEFDPGFFYRSGSIVILFRSSYKNARKILVRGTDNEKGSEVLVVNVSCNGEKKEVPLFVSMTSYPPVSETEINGVKIKMAYGTRVIQLPFSLTLDKFILDRYAGSMSPSSYASRVTLVDLAHNLNEKHKIYMNHVLDYEGYRFFQSSYDADEKGTILSVNHDFLGTWISYAGYILLALGFALTLLNNRSRFHFLRREIRKIRDQRKSGIISLIVFLFGFSVPAWSQTEVRPPVSAAEADKFGHLIVQTFDGRFEPMHTLAYDVMHKISRKDFFQTGQKGEMDAMQVFLDMIVDPEFWKQQKMIYIREKSVRDILGIEGQYAAFTDFLDDQTNYKLSAYAETAFRKSPSEQNTFDKEIIKVDERLNICLSLMDGHVLRIFPLQDSPTNTWISFIDTLAKAPLTGRLKDMNKNLNMKDLSYNMLMRFYLQSVYEGSRSGDYMLADKMLEVIKMVQKVGTPEGLLPSDSRVNLEIVYNKSKVFDTLRNVYGLLSVILLVLAFIYNLRSGRRRVIGFILNFFIVVLGISFLFHTAGMGMRWYLSGHAPWSNGYEALLVIAWGSMLAGFSFVRSSKITVAATALLAFFVLMTAGHSNYDPQLSNLQPVLKSYWLVIHVAVITISYGFLALGFILGLINLFIFLFKSTRNATRLDMIIRELTLTNEMTLTVGLFLATVGTFLGGVWANESWGKYWGWDSKETWALVIVITYAIVMHLRLIPKLKGPFTFNTASVIGFGSVIMTFVGVNYYLSKGLHSYAADEKSVFPLWAWMIILCLLLLIVSAGLKEKWIKRE